MMAQDPSQQTAIWQFSFVTTLAVIAVTILLVYLSTTRRKGIPPGPRLWPIIGNLPTLMSKDILGEFGNLRQKYGDVIGIYVGRELSIFLHGYDVIHDAFVKKGSKFSIRPVEKYREITYTPNGIVFNNGPSWKNQRAFTITAVNEICFKDKGRHLEERIHDEIGHLIDTLERPDQPVDPKDYFDLSFSNIIFMIIHGRRIGYDDKDFNWFLSEVQNGFKRFTTFQVLVNCFPYMRYLPFDLLDVKRNVEIGLQVKEYHRKMCAENFDNYIEGSKDCVFDFYLTKILQDTNNENQNIRNHFDEMWNLIHDLMAAGSETGSTTLTWIILQLALNPNVQKKVQEEIDSKLGPDQRVSIADRDGFPFVQATIMESMRIATASPLGLPHGVDEDVMFRGFLIPKGTHVYSNIFSVLKDPNVFKDPETFQPERFLSKDLKTVMTPREFIPFSVGPRSCLGEKLAKIESFMYTTALLQKFDLILDPSTKPASLLGSLRLSYQSPRYKVHFKPRQIKGKD